MESITDILNKDSTQTACRDLQTPSTESMTMTSDDPRFARLPDTPAPVICEFCKAERYTAGINLGTRILWMPSGPQPCRCPEGQAKHEQELAKRDSIRRAEEIEKADAEMRKKVERIIGASGMGERFLQRTFDTFVSDTKDKKKIITAAKTYARNFENKLPKRGESLPGRNGYLITGTMGTGKTHIAAAIANYLIHQGTAVIFMTERNLLGEIKRTFSGDADRDESQIRRIYETVPLLVIDDIGKEKATEWTIATLFAIIDGRYDRAMPLIITTNYDPKSLVERLTPAGADKTTAETLVDRLTEMCEGIIMSWESWRSK